MIDSRVFPLFFPGYSLLSNIHSLNFSSFYVVAIVSPLLLSLSLSLFFLCPCDTVDFFHCERCIYSICFGFLLFNKSMSSLNIEQTTYLFLLLSFFFFLSFFSPLFPFSEEKQKFILFFFSVSSFWLQRFFLLFFLLRLFILMMIITQLFISISNDKLNKDNSLKTISLHSSQVIQSIDISPYCTLTTSINKFNTISFGRHR